MKVEDIQPELKRLQVVIDDYTTVANDIMKEVNAGKTHVKMFNEKTNGSIWFEVTTSAILADIQTNQNLAIARYQALQKGYDDAQATLDALN